MFRIPRAAAALAATAAVFTLAGSTVATAAGTSAPVRQTASPAVQDIVCTVNDNGVNYRGGPGTNYPVLGQVNRGQKMNAKGREGSWVMGDLWGGRTGVWIHVAYLDC
ncbi:SH3 domain-containing protein [Streptomyces rimosus]|uniref:SH3 domain-containing protein n=1 Tax=Streptomyces TaxID=1883 RepID=UPI0004C67E12|nr:MULTISPECIES: SH3 domain-containing protein [Streptomyces]RSO11590.1 SH3 domain-containing protein [Streptomyces sp. WAC 06783]RSO29660.1 SH3 domain-containing protein [Streptomyces sp. WAC 06725]